MTTVQKAMNANVEYHRGRLLGIAYRVLGSMTDAEDVVQETFLRWYRHAPEVRSAEPWLVTVATRLAIDRLRIRQREQYVGPWLPEPVANDIDGNPESRAVAEADLSIAFLCVLERLTPEERVALVLREVFGYSYDELSEIIARRQDACRQLVHRAKVAVRSDRKKYEISASEKERLVRRFLKAMETGDQADVLQLVAPDSRWIADGGGKAVGAATQILEGHHRVSSMAVGLSRKISGLLSGEVIQLLGEPAIAWKLGDSVVDVIAIDTDGTHINGFYCILNPDKLTRVQSTHSLP